MNRNLIKKILEELSKDSPKLDYVRGILETVLESLPEEKQGVNPFTFTSSGNGYVPNHDMLPNSNQLDLEAKSKLRNVDMSAIQTE